MQGSLRLRLVPIGSYRDSRQMAGCLNDLGLRALRVLRGSNLAFLCALRVSVVNNLVILSSMEYCRGSHCLMQNEE